MLSTAIGSKVNRNLFCYHGAGKFSWFQSGYAYGVWNGVLANFSMRKQVSR